MDTAKLAHPKIDPALPDRGRARRSADRAGSAEVKTRSGGRCEVRFTYDFGWTGTCLRRATQVHHLIGGRGKRGVGISALAIHKLHTCEFCHQDITGGVGGKKLRRVGGTVPLWTDCYERIR